MRNAVGEYDMSNCGSHAWNTVHSFPSYKIVANTLLQCSLIHYCYSITSETVQHRNLNCRRLLWMKLTFLLCSKFSYVLVFNMLGRAKTARYTIYFDLDQSTRRILHPIPWISTLIISLLPCLLSLYMMNRLTWQYSVSHIFKWTFSFNLPTKTKTKAKILLTLLYFFTFHLFK